MIAKQVVDIFLSFFLIGLGAYGGGTVVIPMIEREIVIKHAWLSAPEFAQVISLSQMTPGPIAINAATFVGYLAGGFWGSVVATIGVITPSLILISLIIHVFKCCKDNSFIHRIRQGVRPGVLALIILAVISIGRVSVYNNITLLIAFTTFILLCIFKNKIHPIIAILVAGILGIFIL
jgi:chromate transporter